MFEAFVQIYGFRLKLSRGVCVECHLTLFAFLNEHSSFIGQSLHNEGTRLWTWRYGFVFVATKSLFFTLLRSVNRDFVSRQMSLEIWRHCQILQLVLVQLLIYISLVFWIVCTRFKWLSRKRPTWYHANQIQVLFSTTWYHVAHIRSFWHRYWVKPSLFFNSWANTIGYPLSLLLSLADRSVFISALIRVWS